MRPVLHALLGVALLAPFGESPQAQQVSGTDGVIEILPVHGQVWLLVGPSGNTVVQAGPQGVMVVDTMRAEDGNHLLAAIKRVGGDRPIRYIVNTHAHSDRVTEPLVKTTNMRLNPRLLTPQQLLYPCVEVVELPDQKRGAVPHFLPGTNPFLSEFRQRYSLSETATRGGAETMYPEFQEKLKASGASGSAR